MRSDRSAFGRGGASVVPRDRIPGTSIQKAKDPGGGHPGPDICVINEEEIGGYTFARWAYLSAWPDADWAANTDDFCFFKK